MNHLFHHGSQAGTAFSRRPSAPPLSERESASLPSPTRSPTASSGPESPSGSPRPVKVHAAHPGVPRALASAAASSAGAASAATATAAAFDAAFDGGFAAPAPGLDVRSARPAAPLSQAEALSRAAQAQRALDHLAQWPAAGGGVQTWARDTGRCLRTFLDLVHQVEHKALLGGIETLEARSQRMADLDRLAPRLERAHQALQRALAAMPRLPGGADALSAPAGGDRWAALRAVELPHACEAVLTCTLDQGRLRRDFLGSSERHHPFYLPRMLTSKALYWQAAAEVLDGLVLPTPLAERQAALGQPHVRREGKHADPAARGAGAATASRAGAAGDAARVLLGRLHRHFERHSEQLQASANAADAPRSASAQRLYDPREIVGLKCKAKPALVQAAVEEMLEGHWSRGIHNDLLPERELVLACLQAAVDRARQADPTAPLPRARELAERYQQVFSRLLTQRPNPVIRSRLILPVPGEPVLALGRPVHRQLAAQCEQRPAIAVSEALQQSYVADDIQGAHCHQRTQHKHCTNLYLSRFQTADRAQPLLTLTRHGVLSPLALSRRGIAVDARGRGQVSDEELGRAALELAHDAGVDDPLLRGLASRLAEGQLSPGRAWAEAARYVRANAGLGLPGGWKQRLPSFLGGQARPLIDRLRAAGALRRAREAAEVALASLPDETLARIARDAAEGRTPVVRLASISLLTPDPFRSSVSSDELAMWRDQQRAWAALAAEPCSMPLPRLDAQGRVMRDVDGRLCTTDDDGRTQLSPVRFEVLAMNVPVNEWGTSGAPLGSFATTWGANRQGMERLMGRHLLQWPNWSRRPELIGGWVGQALRQLDPKAARTPAEARALAERRQALIELAMESTRIYMTNAHHKAGADPYKLAKRLIVLTSLLPGTATLANCKSGKDRTSEAEAQARHLALEIALRQGHPPLADEPMTPLRQAQLGVLHEAGGSREIQWWNTNHSGTKLKGQALMAMYGLDAGLLRRKSPGAEVYMGNSKLTHS